MRRRSGADPFNLQFCLKSQSSASSLLAPARPRPTPRPPPPNNRTHRSPRAVDSSGSMRVSRTGGSEKHRSMARDIIFVPYPRPRSLFTPVWVASELNFPVPLVVGIRLAGPSPALGLPGAALRSSRGSRVTWCPEHHRPPSIGLGQQWLRVCGAGTRRKRSVAMCRNVAGRAELVEMDRVLQAFREGSSRGVMGRLRASHRQYLVAGSAIYGSTAMRFCSSQGPRSAGAHFGHSDLVPTWCPPGAWSRHQVRLALGIGAGARVGK